MKTPSLKALARARAYFKQNPDKIADAVNDGNIGRSSAYSVLNPNNDPRVSSVAKLEKTIPDDFEPAEG